MIRNIEEMSLNALPALDNMTYDGWLLRFSKGHARRANSICPLYFSKEEVRRKIEKCEKLYTSKGLDTIFKLTEEVYPSNLDSILEEEGYIIDAPTSVQIVHLDNIKEPRNKDIKCSSHINEQWLETFCQVEPMTEERKVTLKNTLENIIPKKHFILIEHEGKAVGCGLGVVQDDFIGVYNIVVHKDYRNQGYGRDIVLNLLKLGKEHGANKAYLQVMLNNAPALKLYSNIGFKEEYKYWYRVKKLTNNS